MTGARLIRGFVVAGACTRGVAALEMLDHFTARARARGLTNVVATCGDAQRLPYTDASFDAAYRTAVLGEVPDQGAALRELARVLKTNGRLVVGELFGDPHWVRLTHLRARAADAGLVLDRQQGRPAYFARFRANREEVTAR